jgi:hypothetical protein
MQKPEDCHILGNLMNSNKTKTSHDHQYNMRLQKDATENINVID